MRLYDRFVVPHTGDRTTFLASYREADQATTDAISGASLIVEQVQEFDQVGALPDSLASIERCLVPLVSAAFLWPFAGEEHPNNASHRYLDSGPYPAEGGDRFLNQLIKRGTPPDEAVETYFAYGFNAKALDRRFELGIDRQRRRDDICGFSIATAIEEGFRSEGLFFSPHHPGLRISKLLATQCFQTIGVPSQCVQNLNGFLGRSPFPVDQIPVHPSVCDHFKLTYADRDTKYQIRGEGRFPWKEWVRRYVTYAWEPDLFEAAAIAEQDPDGAIRLLNGVLARCPDTHLGHIVLATALSALGRLEDGAEAVKAAVTLEPDDPRGWRLAALIAMRRADRSSAQRLAATAVALDRSDVANLQLLAKAQDDQQAFHDAEQTRRDVVALTPFDATAHTELGTTLMHQGERSLEALAAYQRAIDLNPNSPGAYFGASIVLARLGRNAEGVELIRRAIEIAPAVSLYHAHLGHLLGRLGQRDEEIEAFETALELEPNNAGIHHVLSDLFREQGRLDEAVHHVTRATEIDPQNQRFLTTLVDLLNVANPSLEARSALERGVMAQPDHAAAQEALERLREQANASTFTLVSPSEMAISEDILIPPSNVFTPKCLIYTNFLKLNPEFGNHHLDRLYIDRQRDIPAVSLFEMNKEACLAVPSNEDFIVYLGDKVLADQVRGDWTDVELQGVQHNCREDVNIQGPVVLIGRYGIRTWGHWLGELLPKVIAVESTRPNYFKYILPERFISDAHHRTGLESLAFYGIGPDRLELVSELTSYRFEDLRAVSPVWSHDHMINPAVAALMRNGVDQDAATSSGGKRVALLRRGGISRGLANLAEIETLLVRRGWVIVDIEHMNFRQQVDLFRSATAIVSVLGSGLTGLMYAPRNVRIMTLAPSHWGDLFFFAMMQERNATLVDIRGVSMANDPAQVATANFWVDPAEIEIGLAILD